MKRWIVMIQDKMVYIEADALVYNLETGSIGFMNKDLPEIPIAFFKEWTAFWEEKKFDART